MEPSQLPSFDDLPPVEGMPQGCAWGVFDKPGDGDGGEKDVLGTLNLLTPTVVKGALAEARDGVSISLNWPLNGTGFPLPGRIPPTHKVSTLQELGLSQTGQGFDDEIHFNTQGSSQWDSLCHWQHQDTGLAYNGFKPTVEALSSSSLGEEEKKMPTLDHWHKRGGMVARGVLVDYKLWWEEKNKAAKEGGGKEEEEEEEEEEKKFHPFDGERITVGMLEEVARDQGVEFKEGDVLIVRTGMTDVLRAPTAEDFGKLGRGTLAGVHGSKETVKWLWNKHFAAVAGDSMAFEAMMPVKDDGSPAGVDDLYLHPWLLSLFGMPIGELWDLSALSAHCKATGRYSFLLTSAPLNIPGLVGSPPNALAIF